MSSRLLIAFLTVDQPRPGVQNSDINEWKTLFDFYNKNSGEEHLHTDCGICFPKVWYFCKSALRVSALAGIKLQELIDVKHTEQMQQIKIPGEA
jgi:hypothetical protein